MPRRRRPIIHPRDVNEFPRIGTENKPPRHSPESFEAAARLRPLARSLFDTLLNTNMVEKREKKKKKTGVGPTRSDA